MLQRIGIGQAVIADPQLVILDEPTSALDPIGRRDVRDVIRALRTRGMAVFLNSHLLSEVEMVCDRVAIIDRGRVVRHGSLANSSPARSRWRCASKERPRASWPELRALLAAASRAPRDPPRHERARCDRRAHAAIRLSGRAGGAEMASPVPARTARGLALVHAPDDARRPVPRVGRDQGSMNTLRIAQLAVREAVRRKALYGAIAR